MKLQIKNIVADESIDIRQQLDETTVQEYMDILDRLPPVVVFNTPEGNLLADGFHRVTAAERLGWTEIDADVREGTRDDALEFAATANAAAPLKLTPEERRIGIRRLHRLHHDWDARKIGSLMACSDGVVRTTLQAVTVRREAPTAARLSDRQVEEIARAPREHWEPLATAATKRGWTTAEISTAVRNVRDESMPSTHRQALLAGETEPVVSNGGEPALLRQTIQRHLADEAKRDYVSFMEGAIYQIAQLRRFEPKEIVDGLETERLASLVRSLPADIEFLNEIVKVGRMRLEIWDVAEKQ